MVTSLAQLYVHIVFHTKSGNTLIHPNDQQELYSYMGWVIKENQSIPLLINGMPDHIHILCSLSKTRSVADLVRDIKRLSSSWMKERSAYYKYFSWQRGYGAFSVSPSIRNKTIHYIENQQSHHIKFTWQEEYLQFLKLYEIEYNAQHLWDE